MYLLHTQRLKIITFINKNREGCNGNCLRRSVFLLLTYFVKDIKEMHATFLSTWIFRIKLLIWKNFSEPDCSGQSCLTQRRTGAFLGLPEDFCSTTLSTIPAPSQPSLPPQKMGNVCPWLARGAWNGTKSPDSLFLRQVPGMLLSELPFPGCAGGGGGPGRGGRARTPGQPGRERGPGPRERRTNAR